MINLAQRYNGIVSYIPKDSRCIMDFRTVNLIEKDLEELDELKKILGTPIQEIMKKLKELETIKKWFIDSTMDYRDYDNTLFVDTFIRKDEPIFQIVSEMLDNE